MEIKIIFKKTAYYITFGDSAGQQSIYRITYGKEYYDEDGNVVFATIKGFFRRKVLRRA